MKNYENLEEISDDVYSIFTTGGSIWTMFINEYRKLNLK